MRQVDSRIITKTVKKGFVEITHLPGDDVIAALEKAHQNEESPTGRDILAQILENARLGREEQTPICQDTGNSIVFLEVGQDVHITGETPLEAVKRGVSQGYTGGYLRASIVDDPLGRKNTGTTPRPLSIQR